MSALLAIVRVTIRQLLGGKRVWVLGILGLLPALVMLLAGRTMSDDRAFDFFHEAPFAVLIVVVIPITSLVLGAASLGDERRQDTLSFLALRPIPRWRITAAKIVAAAIAAFLITGSAAALDGAMLGITAGEWSPMVPIITAAAINTVGYVAVFAVLGYLTERAVLIGLGYVLIWENGITFASAGLAPASIWRIGVSAYAALVPRSLGVFGDDLLGSVQPGTGGAAAKAIGLTVLGVVALAQLLRRRDLV